MLTKTRTCTFVTTLHIMANDKKTPKCPPRGAWVPEQRHALEGAERCAAVRRAKLLTHSTPCNKTDCP